MVEKEEEGFFSWYPYKGLYTLTDVEILSNESYCPERSPAIDNFPEGWWTRELKIKRKKEENVH